MEEKAAKAFSSQLTPGSGCGRIKGDFKQYTTNSKNQSIILTGGYCGESKSTVNSKLQFKVLWIEKICREAETINQVPAFYIDIQGTGYTLTPSEKEDLSENELTQTIIFNSSNKTLTNNLLLNIKYFYFDTNFFTYKNVCPIWEINAIC